MNSKFTYAGNEARFKVEMLKMALLLYKNTTIADNIEAICLIKANVQKPIFSDGYFRNVILNMLLLSDFTDVNLSLDTPSNQPKKTDVCGAIPITKTAGGMHLGRYYYLVVSGGTMDFILCDQNRHAL